MNKYDTFSSRIKAKILDLIIIIPVGMFLLSINLWEIPFLKYPVIQKILLLFPLIAASLYPVVMHTLYGQTFGKKATNVKVVDLSEKPIIFGQAVLRSIPQIAFIALITIYVFQNENSEKAMSESFFWYFFSFYLLFKIADYVCGMVTTKNRVLHDLLGKTVVVRTDV